MVMVCQCCTAQNSVSVLSFAGFPTNSSCSPHRIPFICSTVFALITANTLATCGSKTIHPTECACCGLTTMEMRCGHSMLPCPYVVPNVMCRCRATEPVLATVRLSYCHCKLLISVLVVRHVLGCDLLALLAALQLKSPWQTGQA